MDKQAPQHAANGGVCCVNGRIGGEIKTDKEPVWGGGGPLVFYRVGDGEASSNRHACGRGGDRCHNQVDTYYYQGWLVCSGLCPISPLDSQV